MKNLKFLFLIVSILFILEPKMAQAHELKTDGSIGAVFHTDPDDNPIALSPTLFFFEFKDTENKFNPMDCDCNVSITQNGNQIYAQPLFQNNPKPTLDSGSFSFTFSEKNDYQVTVSGLPKTPNEFQTFSLTYDVSVANALNDSAQTPDNSLTDWLTQHLIIIVGFLTIIIVLFLFIKRKPIL